MPFPCQWPAARICWFDDIEDIAFPHPTLDHPIQPDHERDHMRGNNTAVLDSRRSSGVQSEVSINQRDIEPAVHLDGPMQYLNIPNFI